MAGEALTSALPRITPLVLERRAEAFDNDGWLFELKYEASARCWRSTAPARGSSRAIGIACGGAGEAPARHRCHPRREQRPTALDRTAAAFDEPRGLSGCVLGTL